ncbi:GNAT family N-acetyltransferase [Rossellomorea vietnamensis]|uniref:GNAT family N-acetyltransferase n=1 Tax=Rossellomorea vietnamensis TaxID=218284 RepID=A0A5D4MAA9_9BACI|nr:GNAT family N-acetyltransferase [Rossellomorea vietnamensis]TYR98428.1 GNAT family N-acetyltransferase [Rossellomorea vietnamensis]
MTIKRLYKQSYEETLNLSMYAFQYNVPEEEKEKRFKQLDQHELYGIEIEENLAAKLHLLSLNVFLGEKEFKMGGIAGVATYPEYRRKGMVHDLLTFTLERMREKGQTLSMLHPFSIAFYRKYGWELFATLKKVKVPKAEMKMFEHAPGTVRRFNKESYPDKLEEIYRQYAKGYSGMLARDSEWWKDRSITTLHVAIYSNDKGEETGYILYKIKEEKMKVEEFIPLNAEARNGLWNFICQHDSMLTEVELVLHPGDPLPFLLDNPKTKTELHPYFMARVVDVTQFFRLYFPSFNGELSMQINDKYAPWNNGKFLMTNKEIKSMSPEHEVDLELDINVLIPLFFGTYSAAELFNMGLIKGNAEKIFILNENLHSRPGFFIDFF